MIVPYALALHDAYAGYCCLPKHPDVTDRLPLWHARREAGTWFTAAGVEAGADDTGGMHLMVRMFLSDATALPVKASIKNMTVANWHAEPRAGVGSIDMRPVRQAIVRGDFYTNNQIWRDVVKPMLFDAADAIIAAYEGRP